MAPSKHVIKPKPKSKTKPIVEDNKCSKLLYLVRNARGQILFTDPQLAEEDDDIIETLWVHHNRGQYSLEIKK